MQQSAEGWPRGDCEEVGGAFILRYSFPVHIKGLAVQAAAKAAAAAEAASAARAAQEEACSTYTHGGMVAAVDSQAHTSAEPRYLRRKSAIVVCSCTHLMVCLGLLENYAHALSAGQRHLLRICLISMTAFEGSLCMQGEDDDADIAAAEPEQAPVLARPRSASRANTPSLDTSDPGCKRGGVSLTCMSGVPCVGPVQT